MSKIMSAISRLRIVFAVLWLVSGSSGIAAEGSGVVRVVQGDESRLLLPFDLTPENFGLSVPGIDRESADGAVVGWEFREGGQFDVLIKREHFPLQVPESCCNHYLILTMPYTNPRLDGGAGKIAAKRSLFDQIERLRAAKEGKVRVLIDVTWYAKVESASPLVVSLKDRQIYFRHFDGAYVPHAKDISSN